ncbi:VIRB2-interacting protein 2 [Prunus dulcis]|uniref:Reticulon-like protein n=1 Tax=Prunus dulcis TaxID=3755 RepID=A0A4Y1RGK2_PRUDU|nr:VIRB2-interacting protein 2 [Prunus dulcis]
MIDCETAAFFAMAEHTEEVKAAESLMDKIADKIHGHDSPVSPAVESLHEKAEKAVSSGHAASLKAKAYSLFGREKPVHNVFGGGKAADVFLWRDKKGSASVLIAITIIWVFFELLGYHLLTLLAHCLILVLAMLFLWSNASTFINKSPPRIPQVKIPEKPVLQIASAITIEINRAFVILREIASGKDLKQFLSVRLLLYLLLSVPFLIDVVVLLFTLPVFYEKYDDQVDAFAEKAMIEIKKQYAVFDAKVLSKVPKGQMKDKKT